MKKVLPALSIGCLLLGGVPAALGQTPVFTQAMVTGGGTIRTSSYWVDPSGENDLDSDSQAWEDFTLTQSATVTRVRWWGEAPPPLGFSVSFFNQDPNTSASQPDIFREGSGPIAEEDFPAPSVQSVGGGLYQFTVDLATPVSFEADTRYFVSVIGLTPVPFATWSWAQGEGTGSTFWWVRGAHQYFSLPENRAVELSGDVMCTADLDGSGAVDFGDVLRILGAWGNAGGPEDLDASGTVDFGDLLVVLGAWGACA